jgi:stage V sporulation protein R
MSVQNDNAIIEEAIAHLGEIATGLGLRPGPIIFDLVSADVLYEIAAYGLPTRFSHWTHGAEYYKMKTVYDHNLSRIYELVVNTNPVHAYLLTSNSLVAQKLVIAHVMGHAQFFQRNIWYKDTNRHMDITARAHAETVTKIEDEHGLEAVEEVLDAALSIGLHVDPSGFPRKQEEHKCECNHHTSEYDDVWGINAKHVCVGACKKKERHIPIEPERDILRFLIEYSPMLEDWQKVLLSIVRDEWLYFYANMFTKTMSEGLACWTHERILENAHLTPDEHIEFRNMHAGVIANTNRYGINPYGLGYQIWRDIERRWDEGEEYQTWYGTSKACDKGRGLAKIMEVAAEHRDSTFIRTFLTEQLVKDNDLYRYKYDGSKEHGKWVVQPSEWEQVRDALADEMGGLGIPSILVVDGDYKKQRQLYLKHDYQSDARPLDVDYASRTLRYIYKLWGRPIYLETVYDNKDWILSYDGEKFDGKKME